MKEYLDDLYWGNDIVINNHITIHQPKVRDIKGFKVDNEDYPDGETGYYKMLAAVTSTPADYDVQLDSLGVRYEDVDPMDFFFGLTRSFNLTPDITKPLFGDLDLLSFQRQVDVNDENHILYINDDDVRIDKPLYTMIMGIIRDMHNIEANNTVWENEASRAEHMKQEKRRMKRKKKEEPKHSVLLPLISMMSCQPGCKYTREEILDLNIFYFYDMLHQLLHDQQVDHLMTGVYVGLIDSKKIDTDTQLNFIRKDI